MAQIEFPTPLLQLIAQLKRLPGIGARSAERIGVWLLQRGPEFMDPFAATVLKAGSEVAECSVCGFFRTKDLCLICEGAGREDSLLCVVEQPADILPLERSGGYKGHYHTLRGRISPLDNVGPEDLRIGELSKRVRGGVFSEVILALSADVEGEATANYLTEILRDAGGPSLRVTRLARGIPVGGGLESADELTLCRALEGRSLMQ